MARELTLADLWQISESAAASSNYESNNANDYFTLFLVAEGEGRSFSTVLTDYVFIKGKPSLRADAMLARFQQSGGSVKFNTLTDTECDAIFSHPQGGELPINWTWERAENAQLTQKVNRDGSKNNWQKYPRAMLRSRVISEAVRTLYPACLGGMYTPEEVENFTTEPPNPALPTKTEPPKPALTVEEISLAKDELANAKNKDELKSIYDNLPKNIQKNADVLDFVKKLKTEFINMIITDSQRTRFNALALNNEEVRQAILKEFGFTSSSDITVDVYDKMCTRLKLEATFANEEVERALNEKVARE